MIAELKIIIESRIDYENTARLANRCFSNKSADFSGPYLKWKYEIAFGGQTTVIAATRGGQKIGQAVILWHQIKVSGEVLNCAQLVDLFVVPEHRSVSVVRKMYKKLGELLEEQPERSVLTTPNLKSSLFNSRFLKLRPGGMLDIRFGLAAPLSFDQTMSSMWVERDNQDEITEFLRGFVGAGDNTEISWTPESMTDRISNCKYRYAVHKTGPLLAITASRIFKGLPLFLICGLFTSSSDTCKKKHISRVLSAAALLHRRPIYLYVGINNILPALPGWGLPTRFKPSQMLLQIREGNSVQESIDFDRFETIDFDFA